MTTIDPSARRSATVKASEPVVVASVTEANFTRIATAHPSIWRHLAIELGDRLRRRLDDVVPKRDIPRVFIASASEDLTLVNALKAAMWSSAL
jgi:hypothetical protein